MYIYICIYMYIYICICIYITCANYMFEEGAPARKFL